MGFLSEGERDTPESLRRLDEGLKAARARDGRTRGHATTGGRSNAGMGVGMRIAVELAAAVLVGAGIGIVLDRWLGTAPWLLIVFFLIGVAAGFLNVIRTANGLERERRQAKRDREQA